MGRGSAVVGVVAAKNGRAVDVAASAPLVAQAVVDRGTAAPAETPVPVALAMAVVPPELTTEEAKKAAPLMQRLSSWTTKFHRYEANGFGNNISIPTSDINGYVVRPGEIFDFWAALGPVTYERGYRDGGAILNGRTEPTGALAGGICSCSTTLFNAAARAGLEILERANHYYYIDRYPVGLDATVWKTGGATRSMRFRNDTAYPLLIRGTTGVDFVRFEIWGPPTGRTVTFSAPTIKNVVPATDSVQETTTIPAGTRKRIEYPVKGMQVWVTRTVRDAAGTIIHSNTWYSNYKRVNGIVLVGVKADDAIAHAHPRPGPDTGAHAGAHARAHPRSVGTGGGPCRAPPSTRSTAPGSPTPRLFRDCRAEPVPVGHRGEEPGAKPGVGRDPPVHDGIHLGLVLTPFEPVDQPKKREARVPRRPRRPRPARPT